MDDELYRGFVQEAFIQPMRSVLIVDDDYLRRYPMTLIEGDELLVISGIGEWARRVRELRVQYGWWIYTGVTLRELAEENPDAAADLSQRLGVPISRIRPDHYVLVSGEQDRDAAHRWNLLNGIRKQSMGVRAKTHPPPAPRPSGEEQPEETFDIGLGYARPGVGDHHFAVRQVEQDALVDDVARAQPIDAVVHQVDEDGQQSRGLAPGRYPHDPGWSDRRAAE